MEVGDKMSGRYGDKGVVSAIIPDHEMPHDGQGRPFEVLLNPLGIITRTNPAQKIETALGKVAEKTGQPYQVRRLRQRPRLQRVGHPGAGPARHVVRRDDPRPGRRSGHPRHPHRQPLVHEAAPHQRVQGPGPRHRRLHRRGRRRPAVARPGPSVSPSWTSTPLLSHGATEVLRDAGAVRGQQHPEFWQQFMSGQPMPTPKTPMIYDKFLEPAQGRRDQRRPPGQPAERHGPVEQGRRRAVRRPGDHPRRHGGLEGRPEAA